MTRMLEALKRGDVEPAGDEAPAAIDESPRLQLVTEPEPEGDMPFIEVGGRGRAIEASPDVLRAVPPTPPAPAAPLPEFVGLGAGDTVASVSMVSLIAPPAAVSYAARAPMTVAFQPCRPAPAAPAPRVAPEVIAYHQPDHPVSQQYRALLGQVVPVAGPGGHALLLTGLERASGVTTALLNLAVVASQADGRGVAIVDANWARPGVAARLGLAPAPGLQEVLSGKASLEQALRPTAQERLQALTAGATPPRGSAAGDALRWVVAWLRQRFDLVFLDGPAWEDSAEMAALLAASEDVLLVLGAAEADGPAARAASRAIGRMGGRLRGLIVTG